MCAKGFLGSINPLESIDSSERAQVIVVTAKRRNHLKHRTL